MPIYGYFTLDTIITTNIILIVYNHRQSNYCTQLIIIMVRDESIIDFTLFKLTATIYIKINVTS